jgi:hypothetical protein
MPCGAKPQALWRSIYRDSLFPRTEYAEAWKVLQRDLPRRDACRRMVDLLFIAAKSLVNRPAKRSWHICCRQTSTQTSTQPEASSPQPGARSPKPEASSPKPEALASRLAPKVTALLTDVAVTPPLPGQLRCAAGGMRVTARETCIHTLPSMLTALRLPSFHKLWAEIAA